jgi:serine/threonine protein kinase
MNQLISEELEPAELLTVGTLLHRRYMIDGVLGRGTYGITYFGHDEKTGTHIAIKEYFPYALAHRAEQGLALSPKNKACGALFFLGSEMFYRQHLALTDAKGSENLVTVYTAFFENGTSYAVMERLCGITLERFLQLRRRRLYPDEAMFIAASLADALLVVHSLNSLHYDINAKSVFLCMDGKVKLIDFGAAKAGLRARHEVDDTEPWIDICAVGKTLYESMTGLAVFGDSIQPHANIPPQFFEFLWQATNTAGYRRIANVFDYRHALACVEVGAICPDVTEEDVSSEVPQPRSHAPRNKPQSSAAKEPQQTAGQKKSILDRALDAMESAVTSEKPSDTGEAQNEDKLKKKVWLVYGGVVAGVLILALLLRGLIH